MPYQWDPVTKRYRDPTGRYIPQVEVRKLLNIAIDTRSITQLTRDAKQGIITRDTWRMGMREVIKKAYLQAGMLAKGGQQAMTPADWGKVGGHLAEQYKFLDLKVNSFFDVLDDITENQAIARARMYVNSCRQVFEDINRQNKLELGAVYEKWVLGVKEHCADCSALSKLGRVTIGTLWTMPGAGETQCLTNCGCRVAYYSQAGRALSAKEVMEFLLASKEAFSIYFTEAGPIFSLQEPGENGHLLGKCSDLWPADIVLSQHRRDRCMLCAQAPTIEVLWANGRGHAWFCDDCYPTWKSESVREVVKEKKIEHGVARAKWGDLVSPVKLGGPGSGHWGHKGIPGQRGGSLPSRGQISYVSSISPEIVESEMKGLASEVDMFDLGDSAKSAWLAPSGTLYKVSGEHEDLENEIAERLNVDAKTFNLRALGFCRIAATPGFKLYVDLDREYTGTTALRMVKDMARMTTPDTLSFAIYANNQIISQGFDDNEALLRSIETIFGFSELNTLLGGPGSGNWGHRGRPGLRGGSLPNVRVGMPQHSFDYSTWWKDQDMVTVFHGTSVENWATILEKGVEPAKEGYTKGQSFFTTGPVQAWNYSIMGGEVGARGRERLGHEERVVVVLRVPPEYLTANSPWLKEQARFDAVRQELARDPSFSRYMDTVAGELVSIDNIPAAYIIDSFRYPPDVNLGEVFSFGDPGSGKFAKISPTYITLGEHTGAMVALHIPPKIAEALELPGGTKSKDMHVTMLYLGDTKEVPGRRSIQRALQRLVDNSGPWGPFKVKIGGLGRFNASKSSDSKDVFYATVDSYVLPFLRQAIVDTVQGASDIELPTDHGFIPHVTLQYLDPEADLPAQKVEELELTVDALYFHWGDRIKKIPLRGSEPKRIPDAVWDRARHRKTFTDLSPAYRARNQNESR